MYAMVLDRPGPAEGKPLVMADLPIPQPAPGQLRVRVQTCGVCHADLHLAEGEIALPKLPVVPGHQVVGRVDCLSEGAGRLQVGDRVGIPWLYATCGQCDYCRGGAENLCDHAQFTGQHVDGGFAEYMVVPAESAYRLPPGFPDDQAAPLLCAGVIGYRSLRLCEIRPGGRLGLYGFGASAHLGPVKKQLPVVGMSHWPPKGRDV